jgi:Flp pilus assembly protein TadD
MTRHPWGARLDRVARLLTRAAGALLGRPDEALLHALTGRKKGGPDEARAAGYGQALGKGRRALETGQFGEALFHFARASELRPEEPWPWHGRGDALQLSGDFEAALSAYDQAIERAPTLALAHNGRGNALKGLGRSEQARAAWERALELDASLPWPAEALSALDG